MLILFLSFFVLQDAYMYLVCVSHVCVFANVFYLLLCFMFLWLPFGEINK